MVWKCHFRDANGDSCADCVREVRTESAVGYGGLLSQFRNFFGGRIALIRQVDEQLMSERHFEQPASRWSRLVRPPGQ
jgi:hypothetical protein